MYYEKHILTRNLLSLIFSAYASFFQWTVLCSCNARLFLKDVANNTH